MSDGLMADIKELKKRIERLETIERAPLYLPWLQRAVNPFPLASSGGGFADSPQPWSAQLLAFTCTVNVLTTNNGTNYWTLALINSAGTTLASVNTSTLAAATWARLSTTTITQPAATNAVLTVLATATGAPGSIFIVPALALVRTG